jgi:hypothetical protein
MKRLIYLGFLLAIGPALAQPLEEVIASDTMVLRVQQTRTFTFNSPVKEIKLADAGVAAILPESDRTFNFRGIAQGQTLMTAYGQNGNVIYRANISVQQEFGFVKIYGSSTKDFVGYYCTELGCGRGDKDLPPPPRSTTISESRPDGVTISREYR